MDKTLQLIAHLYDEDVEGLEPLGSLLADPELRREYEAMGETRFHLEGRERVRPDALLIDRVVASAVREARAADRRGRPPMRLVHLRRMWLPAATLAASLLVVVLVRPWDPPSLAPSGLETAFDEPEPVLESEALFKSLPPAVPVAAASTPQAVDTDWDTGDDLRQLSRRIAAMREAGVDAWDGEAVPLEAIPSGRSSDLLAPAGASRPRF